MVPRYLKAVKKVPVVEVLCHRVVWALAVLVVVIAVRGETRAVTAALRNRRALLVLSASTVLIAVNWLVYIYSVTYARILERLHPGWEAAASLAELPFLPVGLFKTHPLKSVPDAEVSEHPFWTEEESVEAFEDRGSVLGLGRDDERNRAGAFERLDVRGVDEGAVALALLDQDVRANADDRFPHAGSPSVGRRRRLPWTLSVCGIRAKSRAPRLGGIFAG